MLGLLALYWMMAAGVAVVTDRLWASKMSPYLGCSLMHGVVAAIIGAHIVLNTLVLNGHLAFWAEVSSPHACAFFSLACLSLGRRLKPLPAFG